MMKRVLISVVAAVMVVIMLFAVQTILPVGAAPASAGSSLFEGEGTEDNPYLVATAEDLYNIWFGTDAHYRQIADIVFTEEDFVEGGDYYNGGHGWYPISSFSGRFDGDGYTISGLVVNATIISGGGGLFDSVDQPAEITNVTLLDVEIEGDGIVGGLAGVNRGKISNSEVRGKVASSYLVGGLVGQNGGSIKNSVARVQVRGEGIYNGGLVGLNLGGSIEDSNVWAEVHGGSYTGGLVGRNSGSIIGSVANVEVYGEQYTGGMVGENTGFIINSEVRGKVSGDSQVGGLVGLNCNTIAISTAHVEVHGENEIGGLVGQNGRKDNEGEVFVSAAHGDVYGKEAVGGLVGRNDFFSGVMASVATGAVRGDKTVGGLVGQNQGSLTQVAAYGEVHGENGAGGLVGENTGNIVESYAHGQVAGHEVIGGLTGFNSGNIIDSYAIGKVSGDKSVGGLVGSAGEQGIRRLIIDQPKITNSFWNTETSGQKESAGGVGRTTEEISSFFLFSEAGWDFIGETVNGTEGIWGMNPDDNDGYPYLSWQEFTKQVPVVMTDITEGVSNVAVTTANSSGVIVNIGQPEATEHGHVWSTSPMPTVNDGKTQLGPVVEGRPFTSDLTDLTPNTIHYVRAYVINEDYVAYGEEIEFKTDPQILTINDFTVEKKVYDGDVAAPVKKIEFEGILTGHADFSVGTVGAQFSHRRAGEDNSVSLSSVQLIGIDAYKYIVSLNGAPEVKGLITPRALTVAADAQRKSLGGTDPEFTYQVISGELVTDDKFSGMLIREEGEEAGAYNIQLGTLANTNYQITFVSADLVIFNAIFKASHSSTGIVVSGVENAVRLPELDQEDVTQVVVELVVDKLQADHDTLAMATELGGKGSRVLNAFSISDKVIQIMYRTYCIANSALGMAAFFFTGFHSFCNVSRIIKCIKDSNYIHAIGYCLLHKILHNVISIMLISK